MELKMQAYSIPEAVRFNYEELKTALIEKADQYAQMVYTDDQISAAKADRAALNRLKKALNDERIKQEKAYMLPFTAFKGQINEIIGIIDKPIAAIDGQVKAFEEQKKAEKERQIVAYWEEKNAPKWMQVIDSRWLNASVSMKSIVTAIDASIEQANKDLEVIRALPYFAFEAEECYKRTLSLSNAISDAHMRQAMAERKAAYEAEQARLKVEAESAAKAADEVGEAVFNNAPNIHSQIPAAPMRQWLCFKALLTVEDAKALKAFFQERNVEFMPL